MYYSKLGRLYALLTSMSLTDPYTRVLVHNLLHWKYNMT